MDLMPPSAPPIAGQDYILLDEYAGRRPDPTPESRGAWLGCLLLIIAVLVGMVAGSLKAKRSRRQKRQNAYYGGLISEAQLIEMNDRDAPIDELPSHHRGSRPMMPFGCHVRSELPFLNAEDIAAGAWCCMGSVNDGPAGCTCWTPVYDLEQAEPRLGLEAATRAKRCHDCAYRPDSPERLEGEIDLEGLSNFWCHQGIRRPVAFRHPDGRVRPVHDSADYQPPIVDEVPFKADGSPADRCAGHAQARRLLLEDLGRITDGHGNLTRPALGDRRVRR